MTQSATRGLNYGFGASLNIFDGFAQNRNETTAKIEIENATIALEQQQLNLHSQLTVAYQTYLTYLDLMELEATNEAIAKQNLSITIAKFRIGTITTLEFRTAQLNEINAKVLDDSFTTDLGGESRDFVESSSNTTFAFGLALLLIF